MLKKKKQAEEDTRQRKILQYLWTGQSQSRGNGYTAKSNLESQQNTHQNSSDILQGTEKIFKKIRMETQKIVKAILSRKNKTNKITKTKTKN